MLIKVHEDLSDFKVTVLKSLSTWFQISYYF